MVYEQIEKLDRQWYYLTLTGDVSPWGPSR
jgi:hypothetical protein